MIGDPQLSALVGHWYGREQLFATAWTAAGSADAALTILPGPADGLTVDYTETREGATMKGHGVLSGNRWWWFDSYGFVPLQPGTASWEASELVLERHSERGRTVMRLRVVATQLEQRIDSAVPADSALIPLLRGTYVRSNPTGPAASAAAAR